MSTRRGPGEGSIQQRADGRWMAVVHLGWEGGKRRRKHYYGHSFEEVRDKLTDAQKAKRQGIPIATPARLTVGEHLDRWLRDAELAPKTHHSYEQQIKLHLKPSLGRVTLLKLTPADVRRYLADKRAAGLSPRTVQYQHAILRAALNTALADELVARNVASLASPPRPRRSKVKPLTAAEARRFLDAAAGEPLAPLFVVMFAMGLRPAEALGLRWRSVDLRGATLTIADTLTWNPERKAFALAPPKTELSAARMTMPPVVVDALKARRVRQHRERLFAGDKWQVPPPVCTDLVFTTSRGGPLHERNAVRTFKRILSKAKLPTSTRLYDCRHSCASILLAEGMSLRVISEVLRHSEYRLTADTYTHLADEALAEVSSTMNAALRPRGR